MKSATTLQMPRGSWSHWLMTAGLLLVLVLTGCDSKGAKGDAGSSGTDTESGITTGTTLTAVDDAPGLVLTITDVAGGSGAGGNLQPGDKPVVTFTVKKDDGSAWHLSELASGRIWISGPTFNYQRIIPSTSDVIEQAVRVDEGTYRYTFATGLPSTYLAPYNDSATYGADDGELQGQALLDGAYTVAMAIRWNYTVDGQSKKIVGNATKDFLLGSTAVLTSREVVKNENCNSCHEQIQMHGGGYQDTRLCVTCHTSGAESSGNGAPIDFRVMIHRIHNGAHLPSVLGVTTDATGARDYTATPVSNVIATSRSSHDFSNVHFPVFPSFSYGMPRDAGYSALTSAAKSKEGAIAKGMVACYKCHGDPDGSGSLTAPSQGTHAYSQPSRRACGSCHDDIDWDHPYVANGMTMPAQADDSSCITCHAGTGTTAADGYAMYGGTVPATPFAHVHPMGDPSLVAGTETYNSGINFAVTGTSGSALGYFVAGEKPAITFTLKDDAGVDLPLYKLSRINTTLVGPNDNRQLVFPMTGPKSATTPIVDFSGRLVSSSTSGKGSMSTVVGSTASETLKVQFGSATAFTVTAGSTLAARGGATLPASVSTNPSGSSLSTVELTTAAVAQDITVSFSSATAFAVTGSVTGSMGSGTMPASASASTRFTSTDGSVSFTLSSGSTAFAAGNSIYLTVYETTSNGHRFAMVVGRTAFAVGDRFYYDTVDNALTSYTYNLPMDMYLEFLGDGSSGAAGETFTAGNLPVYWGQESVFERTALAGAGQGDTTLSANATARDRYIDLAAVTDFATNDFVVLDHGTPGAEEYLQIGTIIGNRAWFKTPLRYAHTGGASCQEVTLTARREATDYTLDPTTGTITTVTGISAGNALVVSYRTDGAFGWYRHAGDTRQDVYPPPMNDSPDQGQDWGEWQGLAFQSGTYTAAIWGSTPIYVTEHNETQTYTLTSKTALGDFRYGSAGTVEAYDLIASEGTCASCHEEVIFHGGSRKGVDTCLVCHGTAGMEDWPDYANGGTSGSTPGVTANFRTMLHKIHMGEELANASTYTVKGHNGSNHTYEELVFPVMPGGVKACEKCHGDGNTAWQAPAARTHADQTTSTRSWRAVCNSCHDSTATGIHIEAMTTASGAESCATCHSAGQIFGVDTVHKNR